jgi:hypothetical protein
LGPYINGLSPKPISVISKINWCLS